MEAISVSYQVIEKDYTKADKLKRWGRALKSKASNFYQHAKAKAVEGWGKAKDAIASFIAKLRKTSSNCYSEVNDIINDIINDWEGGDTMGLFSQLGDFLLGPTGAVQQSYQTTHNYQDFSTGNVAESMMGAVQNQNGFISEEQLEQFQEIGKNAEANAKRVKTALEVIKKVSGNETEVTREVFAALGKLEQNAFKRSEYQAKRRQESQILQEKFKGLRKGL